jgi:hypothetical protein
MMRLFQSWAVSVGDAVAATVLRFRIGRRVSAAYQLRCAREDARVRGIKTPLGVWVCEHCPHVSLTSGLFDEHMVFVHA